MSDRMTHWNYRVVAFEDQEFGEIQYGVHDVYYDADEKVVAWGEAPEGVFADSREGLVSELERMRQALDRPVLWWEGDELTEEDAE